MIETLEKNDLDYYEIKSEEYKLVFIKEEMIDLIDVSTTNPNTLLKSIVQDIYPDNFTKMLQSINGVVANINSKKKSADLKLLYNIVIVLLSRNNKPASLYVVPYTYKKVLRFPPSEYGEYITRLMNLVQADFPSANEFIDTFLKDE